MLPLLPIALTSTFGIGYAVVKSHRLSRLKGVLTPTRERIYHEALNSLRTPEDLRTLANAYRVEGLTEQADLLDKRAAIKELPKDVRDKRRAIVKEALTWKDADKVTRLAKHFDEVGANGAAALLRRYAAGLLPLEGEDKVADNKAADNKAAGTKAAGANEKPNTIPVPAVARRRRKNSTPEETIMSNINPFPAAPIPGALNPVPAASPEPGLPPTAEHEHNPGLTPDGADTAEAINAASLDTASLDTLPSAVEGEDGDADGDGDASDTPDGPDLSVTVEESATPGEPDTVNVETSDPENTEVQITESDESD